MEGYDRRPEFGVGQAGLVSTVEDYRRFGQMLITGGITQQGQRIPGKRDRPFFAYQSAFKGTGLHQWGGTHCAATDMAILTAYLNPAQAGTNAPAGEYGWDGWPATYITLDPTNDFL